MARYGRDICARKFSYDVPADDDETVGQIALLYAIIDPAPDVVLFLVGVKQVVTLDEGFRSIGGMLPVMLANTESSRWVVDLLLRLAAKDVEMEEEDIKGNWHWDDFTSGKGYLNTICGVRVSERTWRCV